MGRPLCLRLFSPNRNDIEQVWDWQALISQAQTESKTLPSNQAATENVKLKHWVVWLQDKTSALTSNLTSFALLSTWWYKVSVLFCMTLKHVYFVCADYIIPLQVSCGFQALLWVSTDLGLRDGTRALSGWTETRFNLLYSLVYKYNM